MSVFLALFCIFYHSIPQAGGVENVERVKFGWTDERWQDFAWLAPMGGLEYNEIQGYLVGK
jgi:hypothetical protein